MAIKPYKTQESEAQQVSEPVVAYQQLNPLPQDSDALEGRSNSVSSNIYQVTEMEQVSIMRAKEQYVRGEYLTQEEMDKKVAEWLR